MARVYIDSVPIDIPADHAYATLYRAKKEARDHGFAEYFVHFSDTEEDEKTRRYAEKDFAKYFICKGTMKNPETA